MKKPRFEVYVEFLEGIPSVEYSTVESWDIYQGLLVIRQWEDTAIYIPLSVIRLFAVDEL